jgi:hypothetical protein
MHNEQTATKTYCNCLALERGLDPAGYAGNFDDAILVEIPLPWKHDLYYDEKVLPQPIRELLMLWKMRYEAGEGYRHRPLVVAPDPAYSREGMRRVMFYTRPQGAFAAFDKVEYHVPLERLGDLVWSLYEDRDALPQFARYRVPEVDAVRDLLVCTHGTIDAACSKFGYPIYKHLHDTYSSEMLRVWRVSHFGGHVFAPTLMDMPTAHYWAFVERPQAEQIVRRSGDVSAVRGCYRGWTGAPYGFGQAAERELWQRHGWAWFDYAKAGGVLAQDSDPHDPKWADIRLTYTRPGETTAHTADVRVEVHGHIETEPSTGKPDTHAYPQYTVTRVDEIA